MMSKDGGHKTGKATNSTDGVCRDKNITPVVSRKVPPPSDSIPMPAVKPPKKDK